MVGKWLCIARLWFSRRIYESLCSNHNLNVFTSNTRIVFGDKILYIMLPSTNFLPLSLRSNIAGFHIWPEIDSRERPATRKEKFRQAAFGLLFWVPRCTLFGDANNEDHQVRRELPNSIDEYWCICFIFLTHFAWWKSFFLDPLFKIYATGGKTVWSTISIWAKPHAVRVKREPIASDRHYKQPRLNPRNR